MAGRVFLISPPVVRSKAIHQTSPRRGAVSSSSGLIRDVSHELLAPLGGLGLAVFIAGHRAVALIQRLAHDMGPRKVVQESADVARADDLVQSSVDGVFDG